MRLFNTHTQQRGFTLIELMVVISLIAIFAVMATPAMGDMIARQRIQSNADNIANAFTFARSEAIRLNVPVYIVPGKIKADGKLNGDAASWADAGAILVYDDKNRDGDYSQQEDLRVSVLGGKTSVAGRVRKVTEQNKDSIGFDKPGFVFLPSGLMRVKKEFDKPGLGQVGYSGRLVVADKNKPGKYCRVVRIESAARAVSCSSKQTQAAVAGDFCYCAQ